MTNEDIRSDIHRFLDSKKISLNKLAQISNIDYKSIYLFLNKKGNLTTTSFFKLWTILYKDQHPRLILEDKINKLEHKNEEKGYIKNQETLMDTILKILSDYVEIRHHGNRAAAKRALGLKGTTFDKWLTGERTPTVRALDPIFKQLKLHISSFEEVKSNINSSNEKFDNQISSLYNEINSLKNKIIEIDRFCETTIQVQIQTLETKIKNITL